VVEPSQQNPDKPAIIEKIGILAGQWHKKHDVIVDITRYWKMNHKHE